VLLLGAAPTAKVEPFSFECERLDHGGDSPFGVLLGDWNGDSRPDLAVSNVGSSTVTILLNGKDGSFTPSQTLSVGRVPRPLATADIDGDGDLDLAVGHAMPAFTWIFLGDGRGSFAYSERYTSGDSPFDVALADMNGDGSLDLIVANESNAHIRAVSRVGVHPGRGDGTFGRPTVLRAGQFPAALVVGELDGRPGPDLAVANWGSDDVTLFFNDGEALGPGVTIVSGVRKPYALAGGDLDGDGRTDLVLPDVHGVLRVLWSSGEGTFSLGEAFQVGAGVRWVTLADMDADGRPDLVSADAGSNQVSIVRNRGAREFEPARSISVGSEARMVRAADFDGDGDLDLVVTNQKAGHLTVCLQIDP
jgi:hypothetical protein